MSLSNRRPMNDVMDHMQKVEGTQVGRGGKLPRPIKWLGYFLFGSLWVIILFGWVVSLFIN